MKILYIILIKIKHIFKLLGLKFTIKMLLKMPLRIVKLMTATLKLTKKILLILTRLKKILPEIMNSNLSGN